MRLYSVLAAALVTTLASPLAAQAQGIPEGAAHGAYVGYNTAGPVGWVVGGVVGGTVGGVEGLFGVGPGYGYREGQPAYRRGYPTDIPIALCTVAIPAEAIPLTPARPACRGHAGLWRSGHRPRSIGALLAARFSAFDHVIRGALIARGGCARWQRLRRRRSLAGGEESIHQWPALPLTAIFWE